MNQVLLIVSILFALISYPGENPQKKADAISQDVSQKPLVTAQLKTGNAPYSRELDQYGRGEVLVKFKPGTSKQMVQDFAETFGLTLLNLLSIPDLYLFKTSADGDPERLLQEMNQSPVVEYAEPNALYKTD